MKKMSFVVRGASTTHPCCKKVENLVFIPPKNNSVRLLIEHTHVKMHSGVIDILISLQKRYWILMYVVRRCVICKRYVGKAYDTSELPDLPSYRVSEDPPFSHTSLDFVGLLYYVNDKRDNIMEKDKCMSVCLLVPQPGSTP